MTTTSSGKPSSSSRTLRYNDGATQFRLRLAASILSSRPLLLRNIRYDDLDAPGLREHEASFLRLLDRMTNGTKIEINSTGTQLRFRPGVLLGGEVEHDCPTTTTGGGGGGGGAGGARSVGWFLEGILPLAAFGKEPLHLTLRGITDGTADVDPSPDYLAASFVPLMMRLGIGADDGESTPPSIRVVKRGAHPLGGGIVELHCPMARELNPLDLVDFGRVKRVRGTAISCRIPPSSAARVAHASKGVMHRLLPDVWVHTDVRSGGGGGPGGSRRRKRGRGDATEETSGTGGGCGPSPGLGVMLTATTTEGVCLSAECSMNRDAKGTSEGAATGGHGDEDLERASMELPEDLGRRSAALLLHEVRGGGCVDSHCQSFALMMMCLTPEDVSRIRLGPLSQFAVVSLRLYKEAFGVEFKLRVAEDEQIDEGDGDGVDFDDNSRRRVRGQKTVICSCLGIGYRNMARAST